MRGASESPATVEVLLWVKLKWAKFQYEIADAVTTENDVGYCLRPCIIQCSQLVRKRKKRVFFVVFAG